MARPTSTACLPTTDEFVTRINDRGDDRASTSSTVPPADGSAHDGAPRADRHGLDLGVFIRAQRETARMSVRRLAELAGVSNPYLSQIERGLRRPSAEILQQLARALQISAETLYIRAGFLSDDGGGSGAGDTRTVIAADPRLTVEQRDVLIKVYESFVGSASAGDEDRRSAQGES